MTSPMAAVVPAYGKTALTHTVIEDCHRENDLVDVVIVDNMGDYQSVGDETVLRPGRNLGWLGGTNLGFREVHANYRYVISLNNDVRLSAGFFAGMLSAAEAAGDRAGIIAPCYNDIAVEAQSRYYSGPVHGFTSVPEDVPASVVDGTAYLVPSQAYRRLGELDARHFGRRGWGAIGDLCLRAARLDLDVLVTRRSYLTHERASTARSIESHYEKYAMAEMIVGMRRKWGRDWRSYVNPSLVANNESDHILAMRSRLFRDSFGRFLKQGPWRS